MSKILLVEDSFETGLMIEHCLRSTYQTIKAKNIKEARKCLLENRIDLILLDVILPDGLGYDFCRELRNSVETSEIPIIFVTGRDQTPDKIKGLNVGGDDYISKPFDPSELIARIAASLRRTNRKPAPTDKMECGEIVVCMASQRAWIKTATSKEDLDLTRIEYRLLTHFITHRDKMLTREHILKSIWGDRIHVSDRTVDRHVSALRTKLSINAGYTIQAKYRQGYLFSSTK